MCSVKASVNSLLTIHQLMEQSNNWMVQCKLGLALWSERSGHSGGWPVDFRTKRQGSKVSWAAVILLICVGSEMFIWVGNWCCSRRGRWLRLLAIEKTVAGWCSAHRPCGSLWAWTSSCMPIWSSCVQLCSYTAEWALALELESSAGARTPGR